MMRWYCWTYLPLLVCCATAQAGQAPMTVRIVGQESIPPKWIRHAGKVGGLCPDILQAIARVEPRLHFNPKIETRSLPVIEHALESGVADGACALLETTRRQQVARTVGKPLYQVRHRIAGTANDRAVINTLDELVMLNPLVNTSRGAGYADQLRALGLQVDDSTGDNVINLRKILAGHGRFMYMNELTLKWFIHIEKLDDKIRIWPAVFREEPIYFWVSRKSPPEMADLLARAIDRLHESGELARIYRQWADPN